jgi:hypothetical protein
MITLNEPIQAHGKDITELDLRKPNGGDIRACGYPFSITPNEDGTVTIHPQAAPIHAMLARLANVPPSTIAQLTAPDWNAASMELLSFFGTSIQARSSSAASTSLGSGNGTQP